MRSRNGARDDEDNGTVQMMAFKAAMISCSLRIRAGN